MVVVTSNEKRVTWPRAQNSPDLYLNLIQVASRQIFQAYLDSKQWEQEKMRVYLERFDRIENLLKEHINNSHPHYGDSEPTEILVVEEMDRQAVRDKVLAFVKTHPETDITQLHREIRCDIGTLAEVVDELISEGIIGSGK